MARRQAHLLPSWPAMMDQATAADYFSLSEDTFVALASREKVPAIDIGFRVLRWRKADLDALIDRLPLRGQVEPTPPRGANDDAQAALRAVRAQVRRK